MSPMNRIAKWNEGKRCKQDENRLVLRGFKGKNGGNALRDDWSGG